MTIEIHADQYRAVITLENLPELPLKNIRKILDMAFQYSYQNDESIKAFDDWLKEAIREAGTELRFISAEYEQKHVSLSRVKKARARYERLMKIQTILNKVKEKYYV